MSNCVRKHKHSFKNASKRVETFLNSMFLNSILCLLGPIRSTHISVCSFRALQFVFQRAVALPPSRTCLGSAWKAFFSIAMFTIQTMRASPSLPGFALTTVWSNGCSQVRINWGLNRWPDHFKPRVWNDQEGNRWTIDATLVWAGHVFWWLWFSRRRFKMTRLSLSALSELSQTVFHA